MVEAAEAIAAVAEVAAVLEELGVQVRITDDPAVPGDLVLPDGRLVLPDGRYVDVEVSSRPTVDRVNNLRAKGRPTADSVVILVADQIDPGVRKALKDAGWGWLDRSGHLRLMAAPVHIDTRIPSLLGPDPSPPTPFSRPTALAVALELLNRDEVGTTRDLADAADVSVATAHATITDLTDLGLIEDSGPRHRELFWALADHWRVRWFPLERGPLPGIPGSTRLLLRFGFDDLDGPGWAEVGDRAAQAFGARIASEGPARLYVPSRRALAWALRTWGQAMDPRHASSLLAVPPSPAATRRRVESSWEWPFANPMVVALTLASDEDPRSREVLEHWSTLPAGVRRVW